MSRKAAPKIYPNGTAKCRNIYPNEAAKRPPTHTQIGPRSGSQDIPNGAAKRHLSKTKWDPDLDPDLDTDLDPDPELDPELDPDPEKFAGS